MLIVLTVHLVMALGAPALVSWLGRRAFVVMALAPASAAAYALAWTGRVMAGQHPVQRLEWVPGLGLNLSFRMDTLSWFMLLVVGGVGALVLVYCSAYFSATAGGLRRFGGVLTAFAGAMVGLVTADDLILLFVFWELTTVFSYLLIGHYADRKASRRAAMQAIMVTTAGGLAMLVGLVTLGVQGGTYRLSELIADPPSGPAATAAVACLLVGAASKAALVPLHFWLPAAMAAPTPVSAYLHAAAMVKAGVYLVARFAPGFSHLELWRWSVVVLGVSTLLLGGYRALRQHDLKLILAFGTVSQLGLIVLLVGLGTRSAALAGLALLGAHAMFKASLFLVVGVVDAATGTRDLRRLTGVGRALPWTAAAGALATASMIGLPPLAGYVAKEGALDALWYDGAGPGAPGWLGPLLVAAVAAGSALTVAYGLRLWWGAFGTRRVAVRPDATAAKVGESDGLIAPARIRPQSPILVGPALVLAVLGVAAALVPHLGSTLLAPYADSYPTGEPGHLALWAGLTPVFALTLVILAVGGALFWQRDRVERFQARVPTGLEADRTYRRFMRRLDDLAADVTAVTQRGSLPFYLGIILVVFVAGPGLVMVIRTSWPNRLTAWDRPAQALAVLAIVVASILAARSRRRLKAVILVGVAGYGNAIIFVLHGAPDLALTQVLVETVTLIVMVLVLRRLPPYFSNRPLAASRWVRLGIGIAVGVAAMGFAIVAPSARVDAPPVSKDYPVQAYEFGHGKNVVNVALVDIRAWDTVGEIAVLLVAATGVASLVFLRTRSGAVHRVGEASKQAPAVWSAEPSVTDAGAALRRRGVRSAAEAPPRMSVWLQAGRTLAPERRSVIFEVVTRFIFHAMIVFALFLLFSGHNNPGGGFAAGLVVGIALAVRYLAGGRYELGEAAPVHPGILLGVGLFLSAGVGLVTLVTTGDALRSTLIEFHLPLVGTVHLVTSLFFDIGVFLVVIGLVLDILRSLGAEIDRHAERDAREDVSSGEALDPDARTGGRR